jgi:hypothetical protein
MPSIVDHDSALQRTQTLWSSTFHENYLVPGSHPRRGDAAGSRLAKVSGEVAKKLTQLQVDTFEVAWLRLPGHRSPREKHVSVVVYLMKSCAGKTKVEEVLSEPWTIGPHCQVRVSGRPIS